MKITILLFYLLLALLPTQLGRHFFFDFSLISGIRSDYLAPTLYLTDIIVFLMIGIEVINKVKSQKFQPKAGRPLAEKVSLFLVFCYLLFTSIFIASNQWVAIYKLVKITEFALLGWVIIRIKPKLLTVLTVLSVAVFYTSIISFGQFLLQKSLGGIFWLLGERSFYAGTPGIAAISLWGRLFLRPYATFPHPNVMGGFLAVMLPLLLWRLIYSSSPSPAARGKLESRSFIDDSSRQARTILYLTSFILGVIALFLSFSRAAWIVAAFGFIFILINRKNLLVNWLKSKVNVSLLTFYGLIFFSVALPLVSPQKIFFPGQSLQERSQLTNMALNLISSHPFFGLGLNNFIVQTRQFVNLYPGIYSFQPVHNIYLLVFAEVGLIGFLLFLFLLIVAFRRSFLNFSLITLALVQIYFLGFFDHYLFTLQQGQLLFTVFISLALIPRRV